MTAVFEEMFRPNPQNVHIYIQKINDLSKHYKKIAIMLRNMDTNLAGGRIYSSGRQQLSSEDKLKFKELKEIKQRLKQEMTARN